jgi:hypothetical protein
METLYIVACVTNPLRWRSRIALARAALADWLKEPNVHITLAECAYGSRGWDLADLVSARVTHIPLRATDHGLVEGMSAQHRCSPFAARSGKNRSP